MSVRRLREESSNRLDIKLECDPRVLLLFEPADLDNGCQNAFRAAGRHHEHQGFAVQLGIHPKERLGRSATFTPRLMNNGSPCGTTGSRHAFEFLALQITV